MNINAYNYSIRNHEQIVHLRGNYTANLKHVVKTIKRSGAFLAGLAGPEILGEGRMLRH